MSTATQTWVARAPAEVRDPAAVLASAREARARAEAAEVQVLVDAVDWVVANPPLLGRDAASWYSPTSAGAAPERHDLTAEGVPDVDRAAVAELGLALRTSTQAATALVADALELAYRLPALWTRVVAGEVAPWRARRVAQATRPLSRLAAGYVDRAVAPLADRVTGPQLEGLVETAMARHDRELAEAVAARRAEARGLEIRLADTGLDGLTEVRGCLDLPDAQDLEAAVAHAATQQALWGSADPLGVRRARALGDLARDYLTMTGEPDGEHGPGRGPSVDEPDAPLRARGGRRMPPRRQVMLYVHLTDGAITGAHGSGGCGTAVGRVESTGTPVTAETIREWVGDQATTVTVRPVLDLAEHLHAGAYEVPTRLKEQVRLRDGTCVFPGCHAPGLRCQADHVVPYDHTRPDLGGPTSSDNLALLCQHHHTLKTHHGFRYAVLASGAVLWRTPHGLTVRRNRDGTVDDLTAPHRDRTVDDLTAPGRGSAADDLTRSPRGRPDHRARAGTPPET